MRLAWKVIIGVIGAIVLATVVLHVLQQRYLADFEQINVMRLSLARWTKLSPAICGLALGTGIGLFFLGLDNPRSEWTSKMREAMAIPLWGTLGVWSVYLGFVLSATSCTGLLFYGLGILVLGIGGPGSVAVLVWLLLLPFQATYTFDSTVRSDPRVYVPKQLQRWTTLQLQLLADADLRRDWLRTLGACLLCFTSAAIVAMLILQRL